jgi:fatty-acyl-CoA synthase
MAWNSDRHMECWYGIMGIGAICHTLNPRLFADQLIYIVNHAEDRIVFVDTTFLPVLEAIAHQLPTVEKYIVLTDEAHLPQTGLPGAEAYETWISRHDDSFTWQEFDENTAAGLCYTSGTTGKPKGVLYSHRSNVIHGLMVNQPDVFGLTSLDVVLPIVPMFHANAWALAFAAPAAGACMVMPGPGMDGASIYEMLDSERVTITAAVPTIWLGLLQHLEDYQLELPHLNRMVIGGAAVPRMMFEKFENEYGVEVVQGWGMTETSPVGTVGKMKFSNSHLQGAEKIDVKVKAGRSLFLVELKIVDDEGRELPRDGVAVGHLMVKGPAVSSAYYKSDLEILDPDGFFDTGDIASIDEMGYVTITDRDKDVIKSGGEWISSIEIENAAVGCEGVAEAAVIGLPHPKWSERPLLLIVKQDGAKLEAQDILNFLDGKIAKWWMPDAVEFVEEIPHTATGKILKTKLREQFANYVLN